MGVRGYLRAQPAAMSAKILPKELINFNLSNSEHNLTLFIFQSTRILILFRQETSLHLFLTVVKVGWHQQIYITYERVCWPDRPITDYMQIY